MDSDYVSFGLIGIIREYLSSTYQLHLVILVFISKTQNSKGAKLTYKIQVEDSQIYYPPSMENQTRIELQWILNSNSERIHLMKQDTYNSNSEYDGLAEATIFKQRMVEKEEEERRRRKDQRRLLIIKTKHMYWFT